MLHFGGIISVLLLFASTPLWSQQVKFNIGFKTLHLYDSSRTYKPDAPIDDSLHFRPVDIDVWYPAAVSAFDSTVTFGDLIQLLESRAKFYDPTQHYAGIAEELLQYICAGLNCHDYDTLKRIRTKSHANANRVNKPHPLILYFAGQNGMSYENHLLFEGLVREGFIVAAISSIGHYSGTMTMEPKDIEAQILDGEFAMHYLAAQNFTTNEVGVCGYSWGGLAATLLASRKPEAFSAVVSLNGSERFHYYGNDEDAYLTRIRESTQFKPQKIQAPYLYLDSDLEISDHVPDSIYNIQKYLRNENVYLRIKGSAHEDFSSISVIQGEPDRRFHLIKKLTVAFFCDKLKHTNNFQVDGMTDLVSSVPFRRNSSSNPEKSIRLRGIVRDQKTNAPIAYVNIGIINKDVGTASTPNGEFKLNVSGAENTDSLKISSIGYTAKVFSMRDLLSRSEDYLTIHLQEKTDELQEIVVREEKISPRAFGNKSTSKFFGGKFASDDFGSEMAIRININRKPFHITKFQFNISYNTGDSSTLRFNLYQSKDGLPGQNIMQKNILVTLGKTTGKVEIDLSEHNIVLQDDFFIALEYIDGNSSNGIVFSAGFVNKGTYYRKASHGKWRKYPMGIGFLVEGYY